jgi:hypothetical protein
MDAESAFKDLLGTMARWPAKNSLRTKFCVILSLSALIAFYLLSYQRDEVLRVLSQFKNTGAGTYTDKEYFIKTVLETPIEDLFDPQPIRDLCNNTIWIGGLIFECDSPQGGVGNVENFFMNCVRFAIEAGGTPYSPSHSTAQLT